MIRYHDGEMYLLPVFFAAPPASPQRLAVESWFPAHPCLSPSPLLLFVVVCCCQVIRYHDGEMYLLPVFFAAPPASPQRLAVESWFPAHNPGYSLAHFLLHPRDQVCVCV